MTQLAVRPVVVRQRAAVGVGQAAAPPVRVVVVADRAGVWRLHAGDAAERVVAEHGRAGRVGERGTPPHCSGSARKRPCGGWTGLPGAENGDKRQQHARDAELPTVRLETGEVLIVELLEQHIADEAVDGVLVELRADQRLGVRRDRLGPLRFEAHNAPRSVDNSPVSILRQASKKCND